MAMSLDSGQREREGKRGERAEANAHESDALAAAVAAAVASRLAGAVREAVAAELAHAQLAERLAEQIANRLAGRLGARPVEAAASMRRFSLEVPPEQRSERCWSQHSADARQPPESRGGSLQTPDRSASTLRRVSVDTMGSLATISPVAIAPAEPRYGRRKHRASTGPVGHGNWQGKGLLPFPIETSSAEDLMRAASCPDDISGAHGASFGSMEVNCPTSPNSMSSPRVAKKVRGKRRKRSVKGLETQLADDVLSCVLEAPVIAPTRVSNISNSGDEDRTSEGVSQAGSFGDNHESLGSRSLGVGSFAPIELGLRSINSLGRVRAARQGELVDEVNPESPRRVSGASLGTSTVTGCGTASEGDRNRAGSLIALDAARSSREFADECEEIEVLREKRVAQLTSMYVNPDFDEVGAERMDDELGWTVGKILKVSRWSRVQGSNLDMESGDSAVFPFFALRIFGVLPFSGGRAAAWYQRVVCLVAVFACCGSVERVVAMQVGCPDGSCLQLGLHSDVALTLGGAIGLLLVGVPKGTRALGECYNMLFSYARREGFVRQWAAISRRDFLVTVLIWCLTVLERWRGSGLLRADVRELSTWELLYQVAFPLAIAILLSLALCVLIVCRALGIMVDRFCFNVCERSDLVEAVFEWNVLQAVLRKSSRSIELCFFGLQSTAFAAALLAVGDFLRERDVVLLVPGVLLMQGVIRIFFFAAAVTDKCSHVPSLINSLDFDRALDRKRQYVVEYIIHSAAGFYVFGVCLTMAMVLKLMYVCSVVVIGVGHRVLFG